MQREQLVHVDVLKGTDFNNIINNKFEFDIIQEPE